MTRYDRRSVALAVALSALAGYVDSLGFLTTGNYFVSFMSGNSTRLGVGLGQGRFGYALLSVGVIGLFVAGVVLGTWVAYAAARRRRPAVLVFVALILAVASLFYSLGLSRLGTAATILAMGAENAVFQRRGEVSIGLTYMTGSLVRLGQRLAAITRGGSRTAWVPYASLWLGLIVGATGGTFVHERLAMRGLWFAVPAALVLAAMSTRTRPRTR